MTTAGAPPRGDDDMTDPLATQPGAVDDGESNGLPGGYADTLDQLHQVPVWPGPPPPTAKARRRRRIREILPEVGLVTLVLVILGGLLASAVLSTATVAVYDHARHHGAVITKTAGRPAPRPAAGVTPAGAWVTPAGAGVTPAARPGLVLGSYLAPRTVPAAPSPSRRPVPASSLPGTPGTSPAASTAPPSSSPATPPATVPVKTTPPGSPSPPTASAATPPPATPPASAPAPTPAG